MDSFPDFQQAWEKIKSSENILIVSHVSPDADAISSSAAMYDLLSSLGKKVSAFAGGKSDAYGFIPHEEKIQPILSAPLSSFDLLLILDCGSCARTGLKEEIAAILALSSRPYIIEFDHHQPVDHYADLEIRLPNLASTTSLVYYFFEANGLNISRTIANCILTGVMSDTGNFLHSNASPEAVEISSKMLGAGASLPKILGGTIRNQSLSALRIWGRALDKMHFDAGRRAAYSILLNDDLLELMPEKGGPEETVDVFGEIVSFLSCLAEADFSCLLREENGQLKGSLRTSKEGVDVAAMARMLGGGGHVRAAGFSLPGGLADNQGKVETALNLKLVK